MTRLLIVDDEPTIQMAFERAFRGTPNQIITSGTAADALEKVKTSVPDVIVLDIHLPDASGLMTFREIRKIDARVPIILMTGHGTTDLVIEAMKEGAFDYLFKPLELAELRATITRALRTSFLMRVPTPLPDEQPEPVRGDYLVGRCRAMQEVYKAIGRVAGQDVSVLILGESGTGKELVARAIYQHSSRNMQPFVAINCGAIPEQLVESELFGHERGAFTGADRKRIGRFEQARNGTIFLDEVGELSLSAQVKMLRVLQEQQFERIGGQELIRTNIRLIAATNADLEKMVEQGKFRKDLYFRLNVFTIKLPPLREREDDLVHLVDHYIKKYRQELGSQVQTIHPLALAQLQSYSWPGNIRELQSVLKQAVLKSRSTVIHADDLPPLGSETDPIRLPQPVEPAASLAEQYWDRVIQERLSAQTENLYAETLEKMERELLTRVLKHTSGNQLRAAKILGITRGSLRNKIRSLGITITKGVWLEDDQAESESTIDPVAH